MDNLDIEQIINNIDEKILALLGTRYSLKKEDLYKIPVPKILLLLKKLETSNRSALRMDHLRKSLLNDAGEIPADAIQKSFERLQELRKSLQGWRKIAGMPTHNILLSRSMTAVGGVSQTNASNMGWIELGPGGIGGRTRAIVIDPKTDPNGPETIWAASTGGGVWKSTDGGLSWLPSEDLMGNIAVCSLVMDPKNSNTLYAGTGEGFGSANVVQGNGIYKTTDGWNWTVIKATENNRSFYFVNSLAISTDGSVMLAGTTSGIHISTDAKHETWVCVCYGSIGNIQISTTDKNNCIAGGRDGKIYFSTSGGKTWMESGLPQASLGRIQVTYAAANNSIVYASVDGGNANSYLWKSSDGGKSFTNWAANPRGGGLPVNWLGGQGRHANAIWAGNPDNADLVIVGGIDLWRNQEKYLNEFVKLSDWQQAPKFPHADHHVIVSSPRFVKNGNYKTVYFGNDGGIYKANDITTTGFNTYDWTCLNNNYAVTQFYSGAGNIKSGIIVGGTQDNGSLSHSPNDTFSSWKTFYGGDGGYVASDPEDPNLFYGEYIYLNIFRNTGGAVSDNHSNSICSKLPDAKSGSSLFIAPFLLDPNNSKRMLCGGKSLWQSPDVKTVSSPAWNDIKAPVGNEFISAIAIAPSDSNITYVGYTNGLIYKTTNGKGPNPVWTQVSNISSYSLNVNRQCLCLCVDPRNANNVFACFGGYTKGNIWRTENGGSTWSDLSADLPGVPVRWVTFHPKKSNYVYLATETGVFASENSGKNWTPTNEGPTSCAVYQLFWMGETLVAATFGRGMFQIDLTIRDKASSLLFGDIGVNRDPVISSSRTGCLYELDPLTGALEIVDRNLSGSVLSPVTISGDLIYFGICMEPNNGGLSVYKLKNLAKNNVLWGGGNWKLAVSPRIYGGTINTLNGDQLIVLTNDLDVYSYGPINGSYNWSVNLKLGNPYKPMFAYGMEILNDWLYATTSEGVFAVNLVTKTVGWQNSLISKVPPLLVNNSVYVAGADGQMYIYDARGGTLLRKHYFSKVPGTCTQPVWFFGMVVIGNAEGDVVGFNHANSSMRMIFEIPGKAIQSLVTDGDMIYVVGNIASSNSGILCAYKITDLSSAPVKRINLWNAALKAGASSPPLVVGDKIIFSLNDKTVNAFSTVNGGKLWTSVPTQALVVATPAAVYATN